MMKSTLSEIKFALDNGFTNIERKILKDGEMSFKGSFGYIEVNEEEAKEINALLGQYAPITINGFTTLERYTEHSGLAVGDIVSTGKRTKKVAAIKLVQDTGEPEVWFYMDLPNGSYDIVGLKTARKYKVIKQKEEVGV